jgi:DNA-binding response OmpR family regulator
LNDARSSREFLAVKSVLLIDDDPDFCDVMRRLLEEDDIYVYIAHNGWEGLMMLDRLNPDLILLDLMMPGMDGATFLQIGQKAQHRLNVGVIVVTALSASEAADRTAGLDVIATLEKKEGFYGRVMELVRRQLGSPAHP